MSRILRPLHNCWRIENADRVAFLVDGENYFRALHSAITRARHCIQILSWDIDSRIELIHDEETGGWPSRIGELLSTAIERHPTLRVYILNWDYSLFFATGRELLPDYKFESRSRRRLRFCKDDKHPMGASHHQKIVVIDDAVAFSGGMDIARGRWDTQAHRPDDKRRGNGNGQPMRPYHDVQMAVSGKAAAALGELARKRFIRATRHRPPRVRAHGDPWPPDLVPDLTDVPVAISRTEPAYLHYPQVREVETLYLEAIAAARRVIYIENQYFTSGQIAQALARRLEEPDGPEIVLLLGLETDGWLSQSTMDVLRQTLIRDLRQADRHQRLGVYYPYVQGQGNLPINLHSKILIIDDELLRIGSANLNNRSMGLDTECDLAIEAGGERRIATAIAGFRHRLLSEHLAVSAEEVAQTEAGRNSTLACIEAMRGQPRTLNPLVLDTAAHAETVLSNKALIDPKCAIAPEQLMDQYVGTEKERPMARRRIGWWVGLLLAALALSCAWRWTPLSEWMSIETLTGAMVRLKELPITPVIILAVYLIGSLIAVPITLLLIVTVLTFGPWLGLCYAFAGTVLGALGSYGFGYLVSPDTMRRLAGGKIRELNRRLERHGLMTIIIVRIIPIAPFTIVNMVAGASHIRLRDFIGGTLIGMAPGIVIITLFTDRVIESLRTPSASSLATLALVVTVVSFSAFLLYRWLRRRTDEKWKNATPA